MKFSTTARTFTCILATMTACASQDGGDVSALEGVPEQSAFELTVSDDAESEGLAAASDAVESDEAAIADSLDVAPEALEGAVAQELAHARDAVRALNGSLRHFMEPIAALIRTTQATSAIGGTRTWGPVVRGATEYRFVLRDGRLRRYGWVLQARPAGASAEFTVVAAGRIAVGLRARRGRGAIGIDLDALSSADPSVTGSGRVLVGFAHGPRGSALAYRLRDFVPGAGGRPVTALVQGVHLREGYNRVRLAYRGDVEGSASSADELVLARVRHARGVGGRADVLATGGDIADGKVWVVSECWGPELAARYRVVRECPGDGIGGERCEVVSEGGDAAACPRALLTAEFPPRDAEAPMPDPESPEGEVTPPMEMPDGAP